jgi:hypothetical protein
MSYDYDGCQANKYEAERKLGMMQVVSVAEDMILIRLEADHYLNEKETWWKYGKEGWGKPITDKNELNRLNNLWGQTTIPASFLTPEQLLSHISYWEDLEQALIIMPTEDGKVVVIRFNGMDISATGSTFKEALILYGQKYFENRVYTKVDWYR